MSSTPCCFPTEGRSRALLTSAPGQRVLRLTSIDTLCPKARRSSGAPPPQPPLLLALAASRPSGPGGSSAAAGGVSVAGPLETEMFAQRPALVFLAEQAAALQLGCNQFHEIL